jgi:hypothetical protein
MSTQAVIEDFYTHLQEKTDWESCFADEFTLTINGKVIAGKAAALPGLRQFYASAQTFERLALLIDGDQASAIVRYTVQSAKGPAFVSDVAEFFVVEQNTVVSFAIYFDATPYS